MKPFKTIILAAGKGVRMKSDLPKVLHPVCGRPMIQYALDLAKSLGSLKTYVVVGHKSEAVKAFLRGGATVVVQKRLLGTADAIKSAAPHFRGDKGDVLILCGDTPLLTKETASRLFKHHRATKAACTFLTTEVCNPSGYGRIIRDANGTVIDIREDIDASSEEKEISEINAGVYCFKVAPLFQSINAVRADNKKKEFYLTDIVRLFKSKDLPVETLQTENAAEAEGINTRVDLAFAQAVMRLRILEQHMLAGVTIEDPDTTYIDHDVTIGRDTTIRSHTVIEGKTKIGRYCLIGPFCRIRPGSVIDNNVHIGNFTEVSRTTIGAGTFMQHFSFLGDACAGKNVNIGAGVVTANFDGKNKNKTTILDGAFIGSDSILVAPVTIGKRAKTAAGCVVTKGTKVPDGSLVIGVPARLKSKRG